MGNGRHLNGAEQLILGGVIGQLIGGVCAFMKILFVGDIVGQPGRKAVFRLLPQLAERYGGFDFVVVNGENAAGGKGLTKAIVDELLGAGIHAITTGNHVWAQREILTFIDDQPNLVRPANYPRGAPGCGWTVVSNSSGAQTRGDKYRGSGLYGRVRQSVPIA